MNLTATALKNTAGVSIAIVVILLFGTWSLSQLPIQLFPDIEKPEITVRTSWRTASPQEMESEIIEPIEKVLQGLSGLEEMRAFANPGFAQINMKFGLETDMQKVLLDVISRFNRLDPLPRDASQPVISTGAGGNNTPALTYFFLQALPGNDKDVTSYTQYVDDTIRPALEAVPGVTRVQSQSGSGAPEELQIIFDPYRAAELGITLPTVASNLGNANDVSGGFVDVGRRQYTLRFTGRYEPEQLGKQIIEWRNGSPVRLEDIAQVKVQRADRRGFASQNGNPAISIRIERESGANVLKTLSGVKAVVEKLNNTTLKNKQLKMVQSFDASVFILRAINLVSSNLILGMLLAVSVLWWFLRHMRSTLIVAIAIPISLLSTFIVLKITGRTLNVISLAGLAFAVGMVLDAAIVVLENIVRLREKGLNKFDAALKGASQVWGALLASTATTVIIFVPVIFMKEVEGQLFSDLAMTIAIAVIVSLIVAVVILPAASQQWLNEVKLEDRHQMFWERITRVIMRLTNTTGKRVLLTASLIIIPLSVGAYLWPELDYLPPVKRDAVDSWIQFPPGANADTIEKEYVDVIHQRMAPYMEGEKQPALKNYYILVFGNGNGTIGTRVADQSRVKEMEEIIKNEILVDLPDLKSFSSQGNLFGGFGGQRMVELHLQTRDRQALAQVASLGQQLLNKALPEANIQVRPDIENNKPELRITPNDRAINEAGWKRTDLGLIVRAMGDGIYLGEHFDGEKRINIILRSTLWKNLEELRDMPLVSNNNELITLNQLVDVKRTVGPGQLLRIDRRRSLSLQIRPPENMSLEHVMTIIKDQVEPAIRAELPEDGTIVYGGSANSLTQAIATMGGNFIIALVVLFLLMSALFKSMKDSMMVVLAMPLATVGGIVAIQLLNLVSFQPLDLLTMIGFMILLGLVVNNAILLVHQTRSAEREGIDRHKAVEQALNLRLRPIFMSTLTSIFGMLPLLLMPGTGSVIYRGLAAVIVGGMSVSALFTLLLLPSLLRAGSGLNVVESPQSKPSEEPLKSAA